MPKGEINTANSQTVDTMGNESLALTIYAVIFFLPITGNDPPIGTEIEIVLGGFVIDVAGVCVTGKFAKEDLTAQIIQVNPDVIEIFREFFSQVQHFGQVRRLG